MVKLGKDKKEVGTAQKSNDANKDEQIIKRDSADKEEKKDSTEKKLPVHGK